MENSMIELSNENNLNLTPKFLKNSRFNKSPILISNLSKVTKQKVNNNYLQNSQLFQKEKEQLILDYHRNSINNNNYRTHLPNIITSLTPIERRNNYKRISVAQKNKSFHGTKNYSNSRNFDFTNFFENDQLNSTFQLKKLNQIQMKNNKYYNTHIYSRNIDNMLNKSSQSPNYLTQNISNKNNFNKIKFSLNKKNLMHTIKKPSKINLEKKNLKYKIPLDVINNYNYGKRKILNDISVEAHNNNNNNNNSRKLNIKQRNHKSISGISPLKKSMNENNEKEEININDSKAFIESTLIAFNGLVSQAQELGQILIDNKEMINSKNKSERGESNDLMENSNDDEDNEIKSKLNKLNQEIKNKNKTVEELQKINSDLNNKINLFNENTQQYENKVKELVTVINQIKNNSNNPSNSNSNNSDNYSNGIIGNTIKKESNNNFMLENKPKKKKLKFGFVELIFMKDDKFEMIHKPKPPQYQATKPEFLTINKTHKEPKLVFVNINKNSSNIDNSGGKATSEEYLDAASQMANNIIIESLLSIQNEDEK